MFVRHSTLLTAMLIARNKGSVDTKHVLTLLILQLNKREYNPQLMHNETEVFWSLGNKTKASRMLSISCSHKAVLAALKDEMTNMAI